MDWLGWEITFLIGFADVVVLGLSGLSGAGLLEACGNV